MIPTTMRIGVLVLAGLISACAATRPIPGPPAELHLEAVVPGYPSTIRSWGDEPPRNMQTRLRTQRRALRASMGVAEDETLELDFLVLSGGGSDGAFGAGILNGWTERGDRPEFAVVTGISTGAIIAPFAFLGSKYDEVLREIYTETSTDALVILAPLKAVFGFALGLTDTSPLSNRIESLVTEEFVAEIAEASARGRRLLIGTTNLDAQRSVVWDIGAIASSGNPNARFLIRDVILASSAIPGVFPPVLIEVEAGGQTFTEVHVDGGVTRQLFLLPSRADGSRVSAAVRRARATGTIWAIRNTKLAPGYEPMELGLADMAGRSVSTLIRAAGEADIIVLSAQGERVGFDVRFTSVPPEFSMVEEELFDPVYMSALYDLGRKMILDRNTWTDPLERARTRWRALVGG